MNCADTAEYQMEKLARELNELRQRYVKTSLDVPGNDLARQYRDEAIGALKAIEQIAQNMGLKVRTEYYTE